MFQEAAADPQFQHHEIHLQHGDHDEGEGQHPLLLPAAPRHDALHRGLPHGQRRAQRGFVQTSRDADKDRKFVFCLFYEWKSEQSSSCATGFREEGEAKVTESYEYDLIGVTVHTGTADGGHYYSFIRDIVNPHAYKNNKW